MPQHPTWPGKLSIKEMDLMAIMARGRFAAGDEAKVVFFDGRTNKKVGEVPAGVFSHQRARTVVVGLDK